MKLKRTSIAILFATVILAMSILPLPMVRAVKGPRSDDLIIYYYADVESSYAALKAGDIDAVGYEITADLYTDAVADSNIAVAGVADMGMYEFDLNNNWTIATYPGSRSPMTVESFRTALAYLTDKDFIISEICGGFAERIDQPIAAPTKGWGNSSWWTPNYPYEFDPDQAAAELDNDGFTAGTTTNPYYDDTLTWSSPTIRQYPWGGDLDPLEVVIRTDDIRRLEAGRLLRDNMRKIGIPVNPTEGDIGSIYDKVFGNREYHIYTGGWSLGRFPPLYLYDLYHSIGWFPYGPNYVTGMNASNLPNYPEYDKLLEKLRFPATKALSVTYTKLAMGYHAQHTLNIPLWSSLSYWAWSTGLLGVVNMEGAGPENGYTFMNAYKADGSAIRYGPKSAPNALNIIYSSWYYDFQNLDRMELYGGVDVPPYDLSSDQAGMVTERIVGTWIDPGDGATKSVVTYTYRSDAYFVEPVTGNQLENVNASHQYAAIWYTLNTETSWGFTTVADVHHLNITGPYTLEVYFNSSSFWNAYMGQTTFLSFNLLGKGTLSNTSRSETIAWPGGTGFVGLTYEPHWIKSVDLDGTPLTRGTDYELQSTAINVGPADLYLYTDPGAGTLTVNYMSTEDAAGYTPGNLPWQDALEGAGPFYATAFTPGVGGSLTLKKNPFYYMETPPLGEIDFVKKPSTGGYKIDIFDVVAAAGAYGSQGTGVPSANWFPGADLAPPGGTINIFDIVTITGKYGTEFDIPPP